MDICPLGQDKHVNLRWWCVAMWKRSRFITSQRAVNSRKRSKDKRRSQDCVERLESRRLLAGDLVARWMAETLNEQVGDGEVVNAWVDSAAGITAALGTGTPRLLMNQIGGRSVVNFDAADGADRLSVAADANPLSGAQDFSVIVVFATESVAEGADGPWFENTALVDAGGHLAAHGWGVSLNREGQVSAGIDGAPGGSSTTIQSTSAALNAGQLNIVTFIRSGTDLLLSVNGDPDVTATGANGDARDTLELLIGSSSESQRPFTGDLAEIRFYDGALDATEIIAAQNEIEQFYGNSAPVPTDDRYELVEDTAFFSVGQPGILSNDIDLDDDTLTVELVESTSHGRLVLRTDGSFFYFVERDFFGTDSFTYRARDFRSSDHVATVTLEISPQDDPFVAVADTYKLEPTIPLNVDVTQGVLANDINLDRDPATVERVRDVEVGTLSLQSDGSFTFDAQGWAGTTTFDYRVHDGTKWSNAATVTLVVNTPPQGIEDRYQAFEDVPLQSDADNGVLANDIDVDGDQLSAQLATGPEHGLVTINSNGAFAYTPDTNFHGEDRFTYIVSDGIDQAREVEVVVEVLSVNDVPVSVDDTYFGLPGLRLRVAAEYGPLRNDTDIDKDVLTLRLVDRPANGELSMNADGSFDYLPNAGFIGLDEFTYRAVDGSAESEVTQVRLIVSERPIVISEVMASNADTLTTILRSTSEAEFEGELLSPDWFELRSLVDYPLNLGGMYATDDAEQPDKWQFPSETWLPARGHLVVYASGADILDADLDQTGWLHTNFQISADGESLYLVTADGDTIDHMLLPEQRTHVTYGLTADSTTLRYFPEPTPGEINTEGLIDLVGDTSFSIDRGFYTEPISVGITTSTVDGVIRYTTDGRVPTESSTVYTTPITIDRTTTLRARAFKDGWVSSNTDTQTYLFLADVVRQDAQSTLDAGFPELWRRRPPDYGLDSEDQLPFIAGDETMSVDQARLVLQDSLVSLPTLSIVMDVEDMFGGTAGIYAFPGRVGSQWERATSVELIHPDGTQGFQVDAGIRIQGGAFRGIGLTRKKSFRLLFKNTYGPGKLNYPLFGDDAVDEFDTLTLRMEANDGWQWANVGGGALYARDEFTRRTQLAMQQPASHGSRAHLYINGAYWGMYNIVERPDQSFGAAYFGSDRYQWDGQNSGRSINEEGDLFRNRRSRASWNALRDGTERVRDAETEEQRTAAYMAVLGRNPDGTRNPDLPIWLDEVNYADYLIANYYGGNADWPNKNFYVGRENSPDSEGYKFFSWDAEFTVFLGTRDKSILLNPGGVAEPAQDLRGSLEYRVDFGDRVHRHLFNGGALYVDPEHPEWDPAHPERNVPAARWIELTESIYKGLIAESARWGDQHRDVPYTRDHDWQPAHDRVVNEWFPTRSAELLGQFKEVGLYPQTDAPTFSQRGGALRRGEAIELSATAGTIYYTTDGSDPRMVGGTVSSMAIEYTAPILLDKETTIRLRALNGDEWSALDEATFFVDVVPASVENVRVSEVHYHPGPTTSSERVAGFDDPNEFEFIEIVNTSTQTVDLSGLQLTKAVIEGERQGVEFDFSTSAIQRLDAGARVLVVENLAAFELRCGVGLPVAGQWSGRLSNGSETITLTANGEILQQFAYDDDWYVATDGFGSSLEIVNAQRDVSSWSERESWRPSVSGGTPGTVIDRVPGDSDGDGRFTTEDLIAVFVAGEYEDGIEGNSTFAEGDWDGDGDFTSQDLVYAFQQGSFIADAIAAALADLKAS